MDRGKGKGQRGQDRAERYSEGIGKDLHLYQVLDPSTHFSIRILIDITESLFTAVHKVNLSQLFEATVYSQLIPKDRSSFFMVMITLQKKKHEELWPRNVIFFLIGITQLSSGTKIVKYNGPNVKLWEEWLKLEKHR